MWRLIVALMLSVALAGPVGSASALEKFQFGAAFKGSPRYDLLSWVLDNKGFWKAQGLEVEWIPFVGGGRLYRAVAAGRINMGVSAAASFINAVAKGVPIILVGDLTEPEYFSFWVGAGSPIKGPKDLKGTKMGSARRGSAPYVLGLYVAKKLGMEKEMKIVAVGGFRERIAALKTGVIDGFIQTTMPVANLLAKGELRSVLNTKDYLPKNWLGFPLFAREQFTKEKPAMVSRVTRALLAANNYMSDNPDWTRNKMQEMMGYTPEGAVIAHKDFILSRTGMVKREVVEDTVNFFLENGLIAKEKLPPLDKLYTNKFNK